MKRVVFLLAVVTTMLLFTSVASAGDYWYWRSARANHARHHDELEHRAFHRELIHRDAHRYPMTYRQHGQLHDDLDHEAFHDRLEHRQAHRWNAYRPLPYCPSYGYGSGIRFSTPRTSFWIGF